MSKDAIGFGTASRSLECCISFRCPARRNSNDTRRILAQARDDADALVRAASTQ